MQLAFYFDQTRCIGCNTCSVGCKDWNKLNPGPVRLRTLHIIEKGAEFPNETFFNLPYSCNHCENPACIPACGSNAISKRTSDGVVLIDKKKCIGLGQCVTACPFSAPKRMSDKQEPTQDPNTTERHPAIKCTMCWDRLAENKLPICVTACPARALDMGPLDVLQSRYPDAVRADNNTVFGFPDPTKDSRGVALPKGNTKPCFLVKPKKTDGMVDTGNFKPELFQ